MTQHMNMYEILEKLRQVSGSESVQQAVEQIEAFNNVKEDASQRLDEKYMGWKKTVAAIKKGGSAKDPEAVAAAIGRKKYGKAKFQKAAAAGKKLGEGSKPDFLDLDKDGNRTEPMKQAAKQKAVKEAAKPDYIDLDKDGNKKEPMKKAAKDAKIKETAGAGSALGEAQCNHTTEGEMCPKHGLKECGMYEGHDSTNVRDLLRRMGRDVKIFKATGELTDDLYNELFDVWMSQMPYGTAKARTGDPYQWISRKLEKILRPRVQQVDEIDVNLIKAAQKHAKEHPPQRDPESERNVHKKYGSRTDRDETSDDDYDEFGNLKPSAKKKVSGHVEPGAKRGPGRPKRYTADAPRKERVTAKSRKTDRVAHGQAGFKKAKKVKECDMPGMDSGEYDREGDMAKDDLYSISKAAKELHGILGDEQNLPEWVQSKITKALDYIQTANRYMDQERHDASMDESALQAYLGKKKYGDAGMKALQKAGRDGASKDTMARIRAKHDKMDEGDMEEGNAFTGKLKATAPGGKFKLGDKEFTDTSSIEEKAVSKQQQKFMGMAHAMQKGEKIKGASPELKKVARSMKKKDVEDFAKTKRKGLPQRVKGGKAVDETTTAGSVAPAMTREAEITQGPNKGKQWSPKTPGPTNPNFPKGGVDRGVPSPDDGATAPPPKAAPKKKAEAPGADTAVAETDKNPTDTASKKSKGGMQFGKGIYDSMNRDLEAMISESLNISSNMDTEGGKNITISASDEDAEMLADLLKMAGIGSEGGHDEPCPGSDMIDEVEENNPDWPADMGAKQDTQFMTQTIAGGLNRRKPDQTTLPQTMVRVAREQQAAMEGIESSLWNLYKKV